MLLHFAEFGRRNVVAIALLVNVLEQLLARQLLARLDDLCDAPVPDLE